MSAKLAKLEAMLTDLERVVGINPDVVLLHQLRRDGPYDEERFLGEYGCTLEQMSERAHTRGTDLVVIERLSFKDRPGMEEVEAIRRRHEQLEAQIEKLRAEQAPLTSASD